MVDRPFRIAVLGNPNAGKSTLFNALTGLSQRVGNYPGVTVERMSGMVKGVDRSIELIDLPGTYSLAAHSPDEMIAVDLLLGHVPGESRPDAILAVVDASNLERNLYLVHQLQETGLPLMIALNMIDVAATRGIRIDVARLSERLRLPIVAIRADRGEGVRSLRALLEACAERPAHQVPEAVIEEPAAIAAGLAALRANAFGAMTRALGRPPHRIEMFRALVDVGGHAEARLRQADPLADWDALLGAARNVAGTTTPLSAVEAQARYRRLRELTAGCIERPATPRRTASERIDAVLTHRFWGTLIFAGAMLLLFQSIFRWATPAMDAIDALFASLGEALGSALPEGALSSLLIDGVVGGVGAVVIFLPQILLLFLFLGVLEDCGYMARAAFLMDRLMERVGLSGKSFIPMLSGFACAVPAVMATRVIEDRRDRLATILVAPLMTCSARLPVYAILIAGFIPDRTLLGGAIDLKAMTLLGLYALGVVAAMGCALLFKRTLLRGPPPPFLLEMPSYKWPAPRVLAARLLDRGKAFLFRAGTVILAISVLIWAAAWFPRDEELAARFEAERAAVSARLQTTLPGQDSIAGEEAATAAMAEIDAREAAAHLEQSVLGRTGRFLEPLFHPLGWDWRITVSALASFPAREVIVATLGTVFALGDGVDEESPDLRAALQSARRSDGTPLFTLPVALSVMVFFALCCQCAATVATIRRETKSFGFAWFTFGYMTALAWIAGTVTYQVAAWASRP
jgi:ferrous iron transport protein B